MMRSRRPFDLSGGGPTVQHGQAHVHQDKVWCCGLGHLDALCAIDSKHHVKAPALKTADEHVSVVFVVFNKQDLNHPPSPSCSVYLISGYMPLRESELL